MRWVEPQQRFVSLTPSRAPNSYMGRRYHVHPHAGGMAVSRVVLDLATWRVGGLALRTQREHVLAVSARVALQHRGARGDLHHSNRGSAGYQALAEAELTPSMSRGGLMG